MVVGLPREVVRACMCVCVCVCAVSSRGVATRSALPHRGCPLWALQRNYICRRVRPHAKSPLFSGWRPSDGASMCGGAHGRAGCGVQGEGRG